MQLQSTILLAISALLTTPSLAQGASSTDIVFYPNAGCPGGDPQARIDPATLDGYCHTFSGTTFKSTQTTLNFTGATQKLTLFDDDKCKTQTLQLLNDEGADGCCKDDPSGRGWKSYIYETYR